MSPADFTALYHSLFSVQVNDLTSAHIISYNPDHDFLPMILANCSYTFHVGSGINLEYNYSTLERQVVDRFLLTKSNILINGIEIMVYRSETTNSMVFEILRTKIPQERMSPAVMSQIRCEMNRLSYPDLCDNILNIDTAICFLKSFNRIDHLHSFNDFVVSTLQLGDPCLNQKLKMSNIQSLWVTLSMEKTKRLLDIKKESFDTIPKTLKDLLTERERQPIMEIGNKLQEQQLVIFLEILFECIVLVINIPQKDEEFTDMSKISLADAITLYLDDQPYEKKHPLDSWLDNIITRLKETPGDKILCSKCTDTWITLFEINKLKQREI
ncbi:RNF213 [Mytilus coruscus]|uniref:RNF213 n=1 Tax=Mytilus coruscus TaxID=42192 RepID=A0A6J8A8U7_MYTCO|nr:RNF213 [Mytilus coruscus]